MLAVLYALSLLLQEVSPVAVPSTPQHEKRQSYPDPICSGACGAVHDPSVIKSSNGTYFRFATFSNIAIATAPSLRGPWINQGSAFPQGVKTGIPGNSTVPPSASSVWAPDVFGPLSDGSYVMHYTVSISGTQDSDIGHATSTDLTTWNDLGSLGLPQDSRYNLIDPNLLEVSNGESYLLSWGSYWEDIFQIEMAVPPLSIASGATPNHLEQNTTINPPVNEGSYQFWWPAADGTVYHYLFFSDGACCDTPPNLAPPGGEYKVMVCRSTSPTGGFVDADGNDCLTGNGGTIILASHGDNVYAPGGQGVMYDDDLGSVVIYYHYVNPNIGYDVGDFQFGYNNLDLSSGWPVVVS